MAGGDAALRLDADGAARAVAGICAHAAAEPDGMVSVQAADGELLVASPGQTSLLYARYPVDGDPPTGLTGLYAPPARAPGAAGDSIELTATARSLAVRSGRWRATLRRLSSDPIEVEWIWPAAPVTVEATVSRDALLEALPSGEGRLTFVGADKQLLLQAGKHERRLPVKNRPRRRNDLGTAVAFDDLGRLAAAASEADVSVQLADLRPLTIVSGAVRGVVVRGVPLHWGPVEEQPGRTAARPKTRSGRDDAGERERRAQERREHARAKAVERARTALARSADELESAAAAAAELDDATLRDQIEAVRSVLAQLGDRVE
jgi:hypothetical protein